jgi:chloride channel protein, CIC family
LILQAILLGLVTGVFGVAFLLFAEFLTERLWPEDWATRGWFSGTVWNFLIPLVAGILVGVVYKVFKLPPRYPGFIEDLRAGEVEPTTAPGALGIAVLSLISGTSVGPESPLGTAGGAAGTWLARRRSEDEEGVRRLSFVGISGAFGGLMSTPIGGPLLAFELEHDQSHNYYYTNIVPGVIAGAVSFGVMWPIIGAPIQGLVSLPEADFKSWMLLVAVGLGVVGVVAALVVGKLTVAAVSAMRRLDDRPVLRGAVGGAAVGVIAFALPLTMFSGQTALPVIIDEFETFGVPLLLAMALLKALALGVSLGGGFFGGPIFPTFFIGTVLGIAVHVLIPAIPLALAVGSIMAALGAAVALLPLSMAILAGILIGAGLEYFGAIALASITAFAIRFAITRSRSTSDMRRSMSDAPADGPVTS